MVREMGHRKGALGEGKEGHAFHTVYVLTHLEHYGVMLQVTFYSISFKCCLCFLCQMECIL